MFPLVETIKILDGKPMNLRWHQNRFMTSFLLHFKKPTHFRLENLIEVPEEYGKGNVKLRFLYNEINCFCQYSQYVQKSIKSLKPVVDNKIDYALKYVDRTNIERLLRLKKDGDDILIIKNNLVTDTSFSNIVFYDGKQWITPNSPLLNGTARTRLLDEGKIIEQRIFLKDIKKFQTYKLINAMLDFETQSDLDISSILM